MGCCCSCLKDTSETDETFPLRPSDNASKKTDYIKNTYIKSEVKYSGEVKEHRGPKYYQSVVEDTHGKLINNSWNSSNQFSEKSSDAKIEMQKLFNSKVADKMVYASSPPISNVAASRSVQLNEEHKNIFNTLCDPLFIINSFDLLADELAEIVSSHYFRIQVDDSNSAVVQFQHANNIIKS